MHRKDQNPLHAPDEPTGDELPVEPEMQKGFTPDPTGNPGSEAPEDKPGPGALAP